MQGRVVLGTGSAKGIGEEVARQLAQRGATVLVSARSAEDARAALERLTPAGDVRALATGLDVTDEASVQAAAAEVGSDPAGSTCSSTTRPRTSTGASSRAGRTWARRAPCWM